MTFTEKAKSVADSALQRIGEYSEKAGEKAAELADQAREKAPDYVEKAVELAGKAADATAAGVDKATGGRFHEKIDAAHDKVGETLARARGTQDSDTEPDTLPTPGAAAGSPTPAWQTPSAAANPASSDSPSTDSPSTVQQPPRQRPPDGPTVSAPTTGSPAAAPPHTDSEP